MAIPFYVFKVSPLGNLEGFTLLQPVQLNF
jgi:hypothetical protein